MKEFGDFPVLSDIKIVSIQLLMAPPKFLLCVWADCGASPNVAFRIKTIGIYTSELPPFFYDICTHFIFICRTHRLISIGRPVYL